MCKNQVELFLFDSQLTNLYSLNLIRKFVKSYSRQLNSPIWTLRYYVLKIDLETTSAARREFILINPNCINLSHRLPRENKFKSK